MCFIKGKDSIHLLDIIIYKHRYYLNRREDANVKELTALWSADDTCWEKHYFVTGNDDMKLKNALNFGHRSFYFVLDSS